MIESEKHKLRKLSFQKKADKRKSDNSNIRGNSISITLKRQGSAKTQTADVMIKFFTDLYEVFLREKRPFPNQKTLALTSL